MRRVLPGQGVQSQLAARFPFPRACRAASIGSNRFSSGSTVSDAKSDLNQKVATLEKQLKQQREMLQLQSLMLEGITEMLEHGGNLVERHSAKRDSFVPTLDMVSNQVNHTCQLDNDTIATLAISGDAPARRERLIREIMQVDQCSWDDAHDKLIEMDVCNERFYWFETAPYRIGIVVATLGGVGSALLVFYKPTARFYAEQVVGEEIPEDKDFSSMSTNQVGSWTWEWMEPMIGVASFAILCMQFTRAQMLNLRMSAYTRWMLKCRAERLAGQYPQYTGAIVRSWAALLPRVDSSFYPLWKRWSLFPENRKKNFRTGV